MFRCRVKISNSLKRLCAGNDGEVSFEYVAVAACVVAGVVVAFGISDAGSISTALTSMLDGIRAAIDTAG